MSAGMTKEGLISFTSLSACLRVLGLPASWSWSLPSSIRVASSTPVAGMALDRLPAARLWPAFFEVHHLLHLGPLQRGRAGKSAPIVPVALRVDSLAVLLRS